MTIFRQRNRAFCGTPPPLAMKDPIYHACAADKMANFRIYKPFWRHKPRCTHASSHADWGSSCPQCCDWVSRRNITWPFSTQWAPASISHVAGCGRPGSNAQSRTREAPAQPAPLQSDRVWSGARHCGGATRGSVRRRDICSDLSQVFACGRVWRAWFERAVAHVRSSRGRHPEVRSSGGDLHHHRSWILHSRGRLCCLARATPDGGCGLRTERQTRVRQCV